jgi:glutathione S-transferase
MIAGLAGSKIMSLTLYLHPLSSFCHKALIALYENDTKFTPHNVNLGDPAENAAFKAIWPVGKFPVLRDQVRDQLIPESTSIIEYLALHYPGSSQLIPDDAETAARVRAIDRHYDINIHIHMQKIIGDRIRPEGASDPFGVKDARKRLAAGLGIADAQMAGRSRAAGDDFSMADCAAAPPLFYCDLVIAPLAGTYDNLAAYLERLKQRPSYARALKEAEPYMHMVPRAKV